MPCTVRKEKGQDIGGACGQLVIQQMDQGGSGAGGDASVGYGGSEAVAGACGIVVAKAGGAVRPTARRTEW